MCKKKTYIIAILIPLLIGGLSGFLGMNGMAEYKALEKPLLSPPGFLFPIVWTVLYVLMGIGSALIYCSEDPRKERALKTYAAQLAANFLWTIFFFTFKWSLFAFFWIILLIALIISMIRQFAAIRPLAGKLQLPYLYWLLFAAYLNLGVWYLNR